MTLKAEICLYFYCTAKFGMDWEYLILKTLVWWSSTWCSRIWQPQKKQLTKRLSCSPRLSLSSWLASRVSQSDSALSETLRVWTPMRAASRALESSAPPACLLWKLMSLLFDLIIFVSELDWRAATDSTFTQSWMELKETLVLLFLRPVKIGAPLASFCQWAFFFASFASLSLVFLSVFAARRPSRRCFWFLRSSPPAAFHHSLSGSDPWTLSPTECCMPVKVDANNTKLSTTAAFVNTIVPL